MLYENKSGSLYKLSSKGFLENKTSWKDEVVKEGGVKVLDEMKFKNALEGIKKLDQAKRLKIYYYPERPSCVPKDDSDIIEKAIIWTRQGIPRQKEIFLHYHPKLKEALEKRLLETQGN